MRPVKIITDSCSDMPKAVREKYDIDYARMKTVYNGKEQWASLDFEYYTPKELYDIMRNGERVLTTQVPDDEFRRVFDKYIGEGFDIVYVGCSSKQSGSVNLGSVIAKEYREKNPDIQIFCIDSLNACMGEGLVAIRAAKYRDEGLSAEEIYEKTMADRKLINEYVTVHSLDALKRSGRVKATSAFFGNLLGVKPIIIADINGDQTPIKKVKGRRNSLEELVRLTKESITDPEEQTVYVLHADSEEEAQEVKAMVEKEIAPKEVVVGYIGPIIGASIGPEAIAILSYGKEVTFEG